MRADEIRSRFLDYFTRQGRATQAGVGDPVKLREVLERGMEIVRPLLAAGAPA